MHREPGSELLFFDDTDRERYPGLPDWAPPEAIPGLVANVVARHTRTALEIQVIDAGIETMTDVEYRLAKADAEKRSHGLGRLLVDFCENAPAEVIDSGLPVAM